MTSPNAAKTGSLLYTTDDLCTLTPHSFRECWVTLNPSDSSLQLRESPSDSSRVLAHGPVSSCSRVASTSNFLRVDLLLLQSTTPGSPAAAPSAAAQTTFFFAGDETTLDSWSAALSGVMAARRLSRGSQSPVVAPSASPGAVGSGAAGALATSARAAKTEWDKRRRERISGTATARCGWLKLRGSLKQWALRYFVLRPPYLLYFKEEADVEKGQVLGIVNLAEAAVRRRVSKKEGFCFKVIQPEKRGIYLERGLKGEMLGSGIMPGGHHVAILRSASDEDGAEWLRALEACAGITLVASSSTSSLPALARAATSVEEVAAASPVVPSSSAGLSPRREKLHHRKSTLAAAAPADPQPDRGRTFSASVLPATSPLEDDDPSLCQSPLRKDPSSCPVGLSLEVARTQPEANTAPSTTTTTMTTTTTTTNTTTEAETAPPRVRLDPEPSNYAKEVPRPEMKVDAYEAGKGIILSMLKQLRPGVDLSRVTLPTHILEPRSFLEKTTDYFAHIELMRAAVREDDPLKRMLAITKWYVSGFYIMPKGVKKPYNPLLGEFFRCMWKHGRRDDLPNSPESNSFLVAEQVSHHPPISAFFAGNRVDGWALNGSILFKSKFWGTSAGSLLEGYATLHLLNRDGEEYVIGFPSAVAKGFILGPLTMELFGDVVIECAKTRLRTTVEFKVKKMFGPNEYNLVGGKVEDMDTRETLYTLGGKFDREITVTDSRASGKPQPETLWKVTPDVASSRVQRYVIPLEEQDRFESEKLWRKVTLALIDGDQSTATDGKTGLEEEQRATTRQRETAGTPWVPRLFEYDADAKQWVYKWLNTERFDPATELGEYESGGTVRSVLMPDPVVKEPSLPAAVADPPHRTLRRSVESPHEVPGSVSPAEAALGPEALEEFGTVVASVVTHRKALEETRGELDRFKKDHGRRIEELERQVKVLAREAAVRRQHPQPPSPSPNGALVPALLLALAAVLLVLVLRIISR